MTNKQRIQAGTTALLLIAVMMCGIMSLFQQVIGIPSGPLMTAGDDFNLNSTVTIKTQKAADSIKGGIRGIDVSKYQGSINWKKVAKDDVDFVFVRASYGTTSDPKFLTNARQAHENGLKVGAYHYATFKTASQMKSEAAHFISRLDKVDITYPVVLDLEDSRHKTLKKSTLTKLAVQFMDLVEAEGYTVMLYSGYNFLRDNVNVSTVSKNNYDLWIANYLERPKSIDHKIWQHTSYGTVSGIGGRVDINIAYEDLSTKKSASSRVPPERTSESSSSSTGSSSSSSSSAGSGSGSTKVTTDKDISSNITSTLIKRYPVNIPANSHSAKELHEAISTGLQYEINLQYGESLPVNGQIRRDQVSILSDNTLSNSKKNKITYLVQARLFYLGYYEQSPSSILDSDTTAAIKAFQKAKGLGVTGNLNTETLQKLLM